jgi:ribosomal protein S18 acetylase RimI-like enzyme
MADEPKPLVVLLYPELQDQASVALGRAFINDPTFSAMVPAMTDEIVRTQALTALFRAMFVVERRTGQPTFGVIRDGKVVAAAVTEGAGHASMADTVMAGLGQMPGLLRAIGIDGIRRALAIFRVLSQSHPEQPHLYLQAIGVDPDYQRRHLGGTLLDYLRDQARARPDVAGVYLETATEANVAYYSGKGYEVIGEIHPLGVRMWRMFQRVRS